ncbi:Vegetative incompatibility protein [Paramyrothecium foliicola]|nr:Vegetative incompatibility protein [Paramyrothecium foliicola]
MDGQQVAVGFGRRDIRLWNINKDICFKSLDHTESVCAAAFSQDNWNLAIVSKDYLRHVIITKDSRYAVCIWDVSGTRLQTIRVPTLDDKVLGKAANPEKPLYINFEKEGSRLRIDRGVLDLGISDTTMHTVSTRDATWADYGLSNDNEWITYKGQNVLWLPPDHRPWTWATAPSTVAVASQRQRLVVYRFADEGFATPF